MATAVEIHEVAGFYRAEDAAVVLGIGLEIEGGTWGLKMFLTGEKFLDSCSDVASLAGGEAKKRIEGPAPGNLLAHGEKFVSSQHLQTDGEISVADGKVGVVVLEVDNSVGKVFEGKRVLYDHNRSLVRGGETSFDTEVSLSRKQSLETV